MTTIEFVRWVHLIAAATWVGGMIALAAVVAGLRRHGVDRDSLRAAARAFAKVSWSAMAIAVATGIWQVELLHLDWGSGRLHWKLIAVGVAVVLAVIHTAAAKRLGSAARGMMELLLLLSGLAIFWAAVRL